MYFQMPNFPGLFEIPDDWWKEARMHQFGRTTDSYRSKPNACMLLLKQIEPPIRSREQQMDFAGFDKGRFLEILHGFVNDDEMPPVQLRELKPIEDFPPPPFRWQVRNGFHRFYASVAAGYSRLPGLVL